MEDALVARARDLDVSEVRFARGNLTGVIVAASQQPAATPADDHGVVSPYPASPDKRDVPGFWRAAAAIALGGSALLSRARAYAMPAVSAATLVVGVTVLSVGFPDSGQAPAPSVAGPRAPGQDGTFLVREAGDTPTSSVAGPAARTRRAAAVPGVRPEPKQMRIGNTTAGADLGGVTTDDEGELDKIRKYAVNCVTGEREVDPGHVDVDPAGPVGVGTPQLYCHEAQRGDPASSSAQR